MQQHDSETEPTLAHRDIDLVQRTLAGDNNAFGDLVRRYQGLVYGLAYHRVGSFADAEDVAQEAFVKAFRSLHQLEQPGHFAAWMKTITANECTTFNRRRQRAMSLEEAEMLPSYPALAEEKSRQREKRAEILHAIDSLPEKSRLVMTLHYLSGLSCAEIGEHLDITANAVAQHLNRARKQLKGDPDGGDRGGLCDEQTAGKLCRGSAGKSVYASYSGRRVLRPQGRG
jgi:RNA polymerase sigma-70 factor (ECF subfamily)